MASKDRLSVVLEELLSNIEFKKDYRRGLLGDGINKSSAKVPGREGFYYVRDKADQNRVYQVLGGDVPDKPDWPVILGPHELTHELKVIGSDGPGLAGIGYSGSYGTGPHHTQHEYMGWDMINVHKGMLMPLRVITTSPYSYDVLIQADQIYIGNDYIDLRDSADYNVTLQAIRKTIHSGSAPTGTRYYLAYVDSTPSVNFITGSMEDVGGFGPARPGINEIPGLFMPLAYIKLAAGATSIRMQDIDDIRPLYTFPSDTYATGVYVDDLGDNFTGTNLEQVLEEIAYLIEPKTFSATWFVNTLSTGMLRTAQPYILRQGVPEIVVGHTIESPVAESDIVFDIQICTGVGGSWLSIFDEKPRIPSGTRSVAAGYEFSIEYISGHIAMLVFEEFDDVIEDYGVTIQLGIREKLRP